MAKVPRKSAPKGVQAPRRRQKGVLLRKRPEDWIPTPLPKRHTLLSHAIAFTFEEIGVSASLWLDRDWWQPIHVSRNIADLEVELGAAPQRWEYNERILARVRRSRRAVVGELSGFRDLFVPVLGAEGLHGILAFGPFLTALPTSAEISANFRTLTGSEARLTDTGFASYLSEVFNAPTLDSGREKALLGLAQCFALALAGSGNADVLAGEVARFQAELVPLRYPDRMAVLVQRLLDERSFRRPARLDHGDMAVFGLRRTPKDVIVAYPVAKSADAVSETLQRVRFQRACAKLAHERGSMLCGRLGRQGVVLVLDNPHSGLRAQRFAEDVILRASALARPLGLTLHSGIALAKGSATLQELYPSALSAAERAIAEKKSVVLGSSLAESSFARVRALRTELGQSIGDTPDVMSLRFARYTDAVLARSSGRLERLRAELEVGLERLLEPLIATDLLDEKSAEESLSALARDTEVAQTALELSGAYRKVVSALESSIVDPTHSRRDRGVNRALGFLRDHVEEPVTLAAAARVAGFAPEYFSRLFKREVGVSFGRYRLRLRIEKAQLLLAETSLSVEQIQGLAGFHSRAYFHTAFKRQVRLTPAAFRATGS